jgi:hypothetical protein
MVYTDIGYEQGKVEMENMYIVRGWRLVLYLG